MERKSRFYIKPEMVFEYIDLFDYHMRPYYGTVTITNSPESQQ